MGNTRHDLLKARLALVRRDLAPIVARLTPEMLGWAPAAGMRTIAGHRISDDAAQGVIGDCEHR